MAGTATRRMYQEGDVDVGVIACSQSVGMINEINTVREVIEGMVKEAVAIHKQLGSVGVPSTVWTP